MRGQWIGAGGVIKLRRDNEVVGHTRGNINEVARVMQSGEREKGERGVDPVYPAVAFAVPAGEKGLVELLEARKVGVPELGIKLVVYAWGIQTGPGPIEVVADKVEIGHNDGVSKRPHMLFKDAQDLPPFRRGARV